MERWSAGRRSPIVDLDKQRAIKQVRAQAQEGRKEGRTEGFLYSSTARCRCRFRPPTLVLAIALLMHTTTCIAHTDTQLSLCTHQTSIKNKAGIRGVKWNITRPNREQEQRWQL